MDALYVRGLVDRLRLKFARADYIWNKIGPDTWYLEPTYQYDYKKQQEKLAFLLQMVTEEGYGRE